MRAEFLPTLTEAHPLALEEKLKGPSPPKLSLSLSLSLSLA